MTHKFLKPRQALNKAFLKLERKISWNKELKLTQIILGNQLVDELYGLTEEEIWIVEGGDG